MTASANKPLVGMAGFEPASSPDPKSGGVTKLPNTPIGEAFIGVEPTLTRRLATAE